MILELVWYFSWKHAEEEMNSLTTSSRNFIENKQKWMEDHYDKIFDREELPPRVRQSLI